MQEPGEIPRAETNHPVIRRIRTDCALLRRIEDDGQLDQEDPSIVELKRIIRRRINQLLLELRDGISSTDDELEDDKIATDL